MIFGLNSAIVLRKNLIGNESTIKNDRNYYPQVFLEVCNNIVKGKI